MLKTINRFIVLMVMLCVGSMRSWVNSQALENQVPDEIYIHINKPFFAIGETIWYKAYFFNNDSIRSKVLYIDLISPGGKPIIRQKLKIKENSAFGDIHIPLDTKEGLYHMAAYTKWNENFDQKLQFVHKVPIFEDWNSSWDPQNKPPTVEELKLPEQEHSIRIKTDRSEYLTNQDVTVSFEAFDSRSQVVNGNFSVSVLKDEAANGYNLSGIFQQQQAYISANQSKVSYTIEPETELSLTGTINDPTTNTTVTSGLISIHKVSDHNFLRTASTDGDINITLPDFYGNDEVQIINLNTFQHPEPKFEVREYQQEIAIESKVITRTAAIERYLHLSRLRKKLNDVFYDDSNATPGAKTQLSNLTPDRTFYTKNYQLLKDLREFIDEAIVVARVREDNGNTIIRLFNTDTKQYFVEKPWYLLNGYLIDDEQAILDVQLNEIERIELYSSSESITSQFEPIMIKNGVIAVYTHDGKTWSHLKKRGNNVAIKGFHNPRKFGRFGNSESEDSVPDFDPVIHWEPNLKSENGKGRISFSAGQNGGKFVILIEGVSTSGEPFSGLKTYQVNYK